VRRRRSRRARGVHGVDGGCARLPMSSTVIAPNGMRPGWRAPGSASATARRSSALKPSAISCPDRESLLWRAEILARYGSTISSSSSTSSLGAGPAKRPRRTCPPSSTSARNPLGERCRFAGKSLNNLGGGYTNGFYAREFWRFVRAAGILQVGGDGDQLSSDAEAGRHKRCIATLHFFWTTNEV
jgi:hypothetical protein